MPNNYPRPIILAATIILAFSAGLYFDRLFYPPPEPTPAVSPMAGGRLVSCPSIKQVQEFLKEKDYYYGKIDGLLSPDWKHSNTQAAWDRWHCDEMAMETFEVK